MNPGDIIAVTGSNRTCNGRCDGSGITKICYGKGYYCRRNVWNRYILELVYDWWIPCNVFHGRVLHDTKMFSKLHPKNINTDKCTDTDRYSDNACSVRRKSYDGLDL